MITVYLVGRLQVLGIAQCPTFIGLSYSGAPATKMSQTTPGNDFWLDILSETGDSWEDAVNKILVKIENDKNYSWIAQKRWRNSIQQ